jgi:hypothetical protein
MRSILILCLSLGLAIGNLITGTTTRQSTTWGPYTSQYAADGNVLAKLYYAHTNGDQGFWEATFPTETTVRSILMAITDECCTARNVFKVSVGNSQPPSANPVCVSININSGAFSCSSALTGRYLGVFNQAP